MKQVIVIREDIELSKGKMAAQAAHASVNASNQARNKDKKVYQKWLDEGGKKIILNAKSADELKELKTLADQNAISTSLIKDAGHTEIQPGTITALGIGPAEEEKIDQITGSLETY